MSMANRGLKVHTSSSISNFMPPSKSMLLCNSSPMLFQHFTLVLYCTRLVLLQASGLSQAHPQAHTEISESSITQLKISCPKDPLFSPTHEVRYGVNVVYQIPANPKAILFLAHGKTRSSLNYFDKDENCQLCTGFPEDRLQTLEGLKRGYATIGIQSNRYPTWDSWPPEESKDVENVRNIFKEWGDENGLQGLPIVALGNSAGGNFSTIVVDILDIKSLALMNSPGEYPVIANATSSFPPTFFSYMPKDNGPNGFARPIRRNYQSLLNKGIRVQLQPSYEIPIYPRYFAERIPCLGQATSTLIYYALQLADVMDESRLLKTDPKVDMTWIDAIRASGVIPNCASGHLCLEEYLKEELAVAFAQHAITSLHNTQIFDFFDSVLSSLSSAAM